MKVREYHARKISFREANLLSTVFTTVWSLPMADSHIEDSEIQFGVRSTDLSIIFEVQKKYFQLSYKTIVYIDSFIGIRLFQSTAVKWGCLSAIL